MKAVILNSGIGKRMGKITSESPKCMSELGDRDTILSRQLKILKIAGIEEVVITTGPFEEKLIEYCHTLQLDLKFTFIKNPRFQETNYIYSLYMAKAYLEGDLLLLHGDLVFDEKVLQDILASEYSCMVTSAEAALPDKDFKAVIEYNVDGIQVIKKIGVEFFEQAIAAQPLYKLKNTELLAWKEKIIEFCEQGNVLCYAENAFNQISDKCCIVPVDVGNLVCEEVDTEEDLRRVVRKLKNHDKKVVYMCFSTDIIHGGHIRIIQKAAQLGKVIVGVLSDEAVASYRRFPLLSFEERKELIAGIAGVDEAVEQKHLSYAENIRHYKPDYVVHGDEWKTGLQKPIRTEVLQVLEEYQGKLIEYPYSKNEMYAALESHYREQLHLPDIRRGRLRKLLEMKPLVNVIEAHSGITGLIAEKTTILQEGRTYQFDAMWVSSLCDSTSKGKPDIELVDMSSRFMTINEIMEVTTKPIILDGDTGGLTEHFVYTVKTLERMGVSAVIIEDKVGLKKNSLFGTEVEQVQDSIEHFCEKIHLGKRAQKTKEFMIIARIESLILEKGMEDTLARAFAYIKAGADGIMIHSRKKSPDEIFEFVKQLREKDKITPIIVVPTSFNTVTESEFAERGINLVIYANQLIRSGFPAMQKTAKLILENHRAKEADDLCMSIKEILTLIPEE